MGDAEVTRRQARETSGNRHGAVSLWVFIPRRCSVRAPRRRRGPHSREPAPVTGRRALAQRTSRRRRTRAAHPQEGRRSSIHIAPSSSDSRDQGSGCEHRPHACPRHLPSSPPAGPAPLAVGLPLSGGSTSGFRKLDLQGWVVLAPPSPPLAQSHPGQVKGPFLQEALPNRQVRSLSRLVSAVRTSQHAAPITNCVCTEGYQEAGTGCLILHTPQACTQLALAKCL